MSDWLYLIGGFGIGFFFGACLILLVIRAKKVPKSQLFKDNY